MKAVLFAFSMFIFACASTRPHPRAINFKVFQDISLHTGEADLMRHLGPPQSREGVKMGGQDYEQWDYEPDGRLVLRLLVDGQRKDLAEKTFLPTNGPDTDLQSLLGGDLKGINLKRSPLRCRHWNEILLFNEPQGLLIIAQDGANPRIISITSSLKENMALHLKENEAKTCRP